MAEPSPRNTGHKQVVLCKSVEMPHQTTNGRRRTAQTDRIAVEKVGVCRLVLSVDGASSSSMAVADGQMGRLAVVGKLH